MTDCSLEARTDRWELRYATPMWPDDEQDIKRRQTRSPRLQQCEHKRFHRQDVWQHVGKCKTAPRPARLQSKPSRDPEYALASWAAGQSRSSPRAPFLLPRCKIGVGERSVERIAGWILEKKEKKKRCTKATCTSRTGGFVYVITRVTTEPIVGDWLRRFEIGKLEALDLVQTPCVRLAARQATARRAPTSTTTPRRRLHPHRRCVDLLNTSPKDTLSSTKIRAFDDPRTLVLSLTSTLSLSPIDFPLARSSLSPLSLLHRHFPCRTDRQNGSSRLAAGRKLRSSKEGSGTDGGAGGHTDVEHNHRGAVSTLVFVRRAR